MNFTYSAYVSFIELLHNMGYKILSYDNFQGENYCVILRHDVDNSLLSAYKLAQVERKLGVKSTYFLLLTSDFYNVFSLNGMRMIDGILSCGHEIGLHFDEARYPDSLGRIDAVKDRIMEEVGILSKAVGQQITKVSMHRPSKQIIKANLEIPGIVNTYSETFFLKFKYVSDSRHVWREPIEDIIRNRLYKRLQILVHPFWYNEEAADIKESVSKFINNANKERYQIMDENFTDLSEIMDKSEICQ